MTPGYLEVRYHVTVESNATEEDIIRVLDRAESHSPWLDVYRKPQTLKRSLQLRPHTEPA